MKGAHDKAQWQRLQSLPNLIYADGNEFSLWRNGELASPLVRLDGDIETSGDKLAPGQGIQALFEFFFQWDPKAPDTAKELAEISARLCRLLRDEVTEALAEKSDALTILATDWRALLFPQATDSQFADSYAQAVTFGLLTARARGISIGSGMHAVSEELKKTASLIGTALQLLTDSVETRKALSTSLRTLERVLDVVDWPKISKGRSDAWLYFYEDFLEVYDNDLRKQTGSYYTPPEVVGSMVSLVDEALRRYRRWATNDRLRHSATSSPRPGRLSTRPSCSTCSMCWACSSTLSRTPMPCWHESALVRCWMPWRCERRASSPMHRSARPNDAERPVVRSPCQTRA